MEIARGEVLVSSQDGSGIYRNPGGSLFKGGVQIQLRSQERLASFTDEVTDEVT